MNRLPRPNPTRIDRSLLNRALQLDGFDDWHPKFDVLHLPRPRRRPADLPGTGRYAAVLVLLYEKANQWWVVLTRRRDDLRKHAGQISLPGGSQDPGESLVETALRETEEEIGVGPKQIDLLGQLNPVYIPPSDFTVTPFVGTSQGRPDFQRQVEEVAEILETPLDLLLDERSFANGSVKHGVGDRTIEAPHFVFGSHQIWGATALILSELVERLKKADQKAPQ